MLRLFLKDQFDVCMFGWFFFFFLRVSLLFQFSGLTAFNIFSNFCCSHECFDKGWLVEPSPEGYIFPVWPLPLQGGWAISRFLIGILLILWWQTKAQGAGILWAFCCNSGQELQKSIQLYQVGNWEGRTICSLIISSEAVVVLLDFGRRC